MVNALKYNELLTKSGWSKEQTTGLIEVLSDMADQNFVTKTDLKLEINTFKSEVKLEFSELRNEVQAVKTDLHNEILTVKTELDSKIQNLNHNFTVLDKKIETQSDKIVIRLGGLMVGLTAIISVFFGILK